MYLVLDGLMGNKCYTYIDDILVFGSTEEKHDRNLKEVVTRLQGLGLKINREKSIFKQKEVDFLGYRISQNRIYPPLKRAEAISNFEAPRNKRAVRRFVGIPNYDRNFIPRLSELAKPLYELIEVKTFEWTEKGQNAFETIKSNRIKELEPCTPEEGKRYSLESGASDIALGAT